MKNKIVKSIIIFVISIILLISFDQITKVISNKLLSDHDVTIIKDFFSLQLIYNKGAAFGMLKNSRIFFCILTIAILLLIEFIYIKIPYDKKYRILKIDLIVLFAGAAGNLIDRIKYGYVTDFLAFDFGNYSFPRFNVADIYVTISTIVLFILFLFVYKEEDFALILGRKQNGK